MKQIFVIGGGITGLSCAYRLSQHADAKIRVFEAGNHLGGAARNFGDAEWRFEYGPHNIHSQDVNVLNFLKDVFKNELRPRKVEARLYIFDKNVTYPLKGIDTLLILNPLDTIRVGFDFFIARLRAFFFGIAKTERFDEWIIRRFGKKLFEIYFAPYVRKVWKIDPSQLSYYVGERRIPILSIKQLILRQLGLIRKKKHHPEDIEHVKSFMPVRGSGRIADYFFQESLNADADVEFQRQTEVVEIESEHGQIRKIHTAVASANKKTTHELSDADIVISSMPLPDLINIMKPVDRHITAHAQSLSYTSLRFLYLKIKGAPPFKQSWVYFSDNRILFNRISEYYYDDLRMVPEGYVSLCIEIPCSYCDAIWNMPDDELYKIVLAQLRRYCDIEDNSISGYRTETLHYAYPRFDVHYSDNLKIISDYLLTHNNIISIGRQGLFCYANIDQCIQMGFDTADSIIQKNAHINNVYAKLIQQYHDKSAYSI